MGLHPASVTSELYHYGHIPYYSEFCFFFFNFFFKIFFPLMYMRVCKCTICTPGAHKGQKSTLDPQELDLQKVVTHRVGGDDQTRVLCKSCQFF